MSKKLPEIWEGLASAPTTEDGIRRLRLDPDCFKIYAGWCLPENQPALVLEVTVKALPNDIEYPQSTGFRLTVDALKPGREGLSRIILRAKDVQFSDIFPVLVQDVYDYIKQSENETTLVRRLVTRLHCWQVFLKRHRLARLPESKVIGLWGELWYLKSRLIPYIGIDASIRCWRGPDGCNQDFEFGGIAVEIKTTASNPHEKVSISNLRQLEVDGLIDLYLYHIAVAVHQDSGISLPELIDQIRSQIASCPNAIESFNEKLFQTGYLDSEAGWYRRTGFHTIKQNAYKIGSGFPRITLESVPNGVGDIKYSIVLSACSDFLVTPDPFLGDNANDD